MTVALLQSANLIKTSSGDDAFALVAPRTVYNLKWTASGTKTITLTGLGFGMVIFAGDGNFYARYDSDATPPVFPVTADNTSGTGWVINPAQWALNGGLTYLHLASVADDRFVSLEFFGMYSKG